MGNRDRFALLSCITSAVVLLAALSCVAVKPPAEAARPDIILLTIDTLRADRVQLTGRHGPAATIDDIGREGAAFLDATAHAPLTLPSHASIFTGRYPVAHGVHDNAGFTLSPSLPPCDSRRTRASR